MSLVTAKEMLSDAKKRGYAIGAFNAENMEMAMGIIQAAEELRSPVMIGTTPLMIKYSSVEIYASMIGAMARKASVPVCLHLDHGDSFERAVQCVASGYTSIMIDGSALPFEENIALSRRVADMASVMDIPTEAELGRIHGQEDGISGEDGFCTDPAEAKEFVQRTGVFSLAVAIGTAHGVYKETPELNIDCLSEIQEAVDVPLVLHGASGLPDEQIRACVREGICKINFATELRQAYSGVIRSFFEQNPHVYDPKQYGVCAIDAVKELVKCRMRVLGSDGRA